MFPINAKSIYNKIDTKQPFRKWFWDKVKEYKFIVGVDYDVKVAGSSSISPEPYIISITLNTALKLGL